jgi:hypothetical protein
MQLGGRVQDVGHEPGMDNYGCLHVLTCSMISTRRKIGVTLFGITQRMLQNFGTTLKRNKWIMWTEVMTTSNIVLERQQREVYHTHLQLRGNFGANLRNALKPQESTNLQQTRTVLTEVTG